MKVTKFIKDNFIGIIIGGLFFGTLSVFATSMISSEIVSYSSTKTTATNVKLAVDELYNYAKTGNAGAGDILSGKSALVNGKAITGSMTNRGAWTSTPTSNGKVTIPAGYHNGLGYVDTGSVYNLGSSNVFASIRNNATASKTSTSNLSTAFKNVTDLASLRTAIVNENKNSEKEARNFIGTKSITVSYVDNNKTHIVYPDGHKPMIIKWDITHKTDDAPGYYHAYTHRMSLETFTDAKGAVINNEGFYWWYMHPDSGTNSTSMSGYVTMNDTDGYFTFYSSCPEAWAGTLTMYY